MLQKHLDTIRKKPKSVRSQYAMAAASVFTGVLALVWVTTLPGRFAMESVDPLVQQQVAAEAAKEEARPSGIGALVGSLRDGMAALIFKTDAEMNGVSEEAGTETETKTIDIEALLQESSASEAPTPVFEDATTTATTTAIAPTTRPSVQNNNEPAPKPKEETAPVGQVILIGTTSSQKTIPGNP